MTKLEGFLIGNCANNYNLTMQIKDMYTNLYLSSKKEKKF